MSTAAPLPPHPADHLPVGRCRRPLAAAQQHLARDRRLTLGFLGGSITADVGYNWPEGVARWFARTFPEVRFAVENAAIGGTGSDSGCLRAPREIIDTGCQLTFVEYAVNDNGTPTARRNPSREGLIRRLLAAGQEVVLVYVYCPAMYEDMAAGRVPASIAELETLADHYGLNSVWAGLHAFREVHEGKMKWAEWLPDGLHPQHRGSWSYAEAVTRLLIDAMPGVFGAGDTTPQPAATLPEPLDVRHWQHAAPLPWSQVATTGPWLLRRVQDWHTGQILETHTPGAGLAFEFTGRALALIFEFGSRSADFRYRLDGGEWTPVAQTRFDWGGEHGLVIPCVVADDLADGTHRFELETVHENRPESAGTECRLALVGVVP